MRGCLIPLLDLVSSFRLVKLGVRFSRTGLSCVVVKLDFRAPRKSFAVAAVAA